MVEFGLRRAQGPDGGLSASKYAYVGGCDSTSNVLAGKLFDIPVKGTHAHAFVMSFAACSLHRRLEGSEAADEEGQAIGTEDLPIRLLPDRRTGESVDFVDLCIRCRREVCRITGIEESQANDGEFAAFIAYAISFPSAFMALIDTYDVVK